MNEIKRPDSFLDENHAKAVITSWITNGEVLHQEKLKSFLLGHKGKSRTKFFKMIDSLERLYGDLVVSRRNSKNSKGNISNRPRFVELAFFSDRITLPYHKTKLLPIVVMGFDTKNLDFSDPVCSFYLSEHLLARLIMRSKAKSLKDIASWAEAHYLFIMESKFNGDLPTEDFILITKDSFIPFTFINDIEKENGLVAKTWIPRSEWSKNMLSKLSPYLDDMDKISGCNGGLINAEDFNNKI